MPDMKIGLLGTQLGNRSIQSFSVFWGNHAQYLLASRVHPLIFPKNLLDPFGTHDLIRDGIPLKGKHLSGSDRHTQPFFALSQRLFGPLLLGDIEPNPDVTCKRAVLIEPWNTDVDNPSIFSIVPSESILHPKLLSPIK
jgi:hypothetical protein